MFDTLINADMRPVGHHFQPYADNGGTVVALAGPDFVVIGSDTRLSTGFQILTRDQTKLFELTPKCILGSTGCWCDILTFRKVLDARLTMYSQDHNKTISTPALAQLLSNMLYNKRFFPYYITNIVAGLDTDGRGCIFSYDPVGHCERNTYTAGGSSSALIQPLLDSQVGLKNQEGVPARDLTLESAKNLIKDVFISASERDIYCGDSVDIRIVTKDGIQTETMALRRD
ncbi:proteasome subunit beta type-1-like [Oppia nitens]|uniref:proteasome subunit beta type-1-like n=1 Tax=Oppia nitens TaxID=1686743 RepID=UPI0023DAF938|nr:proteasome subunit beta type-1-like [Oppia nitens]